MKTRNLIRAWILIFLVFFFGQILQRVGYSNLFVSGYLDDLVALPLVLGGILIFYRLVSKKNINLLIPTKHVLVTTLIFSVYFEVIAPQFLPTFTADFFDVVCYCSGSLFFHGVLNKSFELKHVNPKPTL